MQNTLNFKRKEIKKQIRQIAKNVKMCFPLKACFVSLCSSSGEMIIILPLVDLSPCVDECVENTRRRLASSKNHYSCLSSWLVVAGNFFSANRQVVMHPRRSVDLVLMKWRCSNEWILKATERWFLFYFRLEVYRPKDERRLWIFKLFDLTNLLRLLDKCCSGVLNESSLIAKRLLFKDGTPELT